MFTIIPTQNARKCVALNWPLLARERDYFRLICRTKKDRRRRHIHTVSFSTRSHYWTEKQYIFRGKIITHTTETNREKKLCMNRAYMYTRRTFSYFRLFLSVKSFRVHMILYQVCVSK